eukprot:g5552.t1
MSNKELETLCSQLHKDNTTLVKTIAVLEQKVSDLDNKKELSNQPLPALYVQLDSTKKTLSNLEKQKHDLETQNMELVLRLEKSESSRDLEHEVHDPVPHTRVTELENEKLILAEKLVKKDEDLLELQRKFNEQAKQLNTLEAGIDGVETRFDLQISKHINRMNQQLELLFQKAARFEVNEREAQQDVSKLRQDVSGALKSVPEGLRKMKGSLKSMMSKNDQEREEMEELLETKTRNLKEAKKQIMLLSENICTQNSEINELRSYVDDLETKIARLKTERLVPHNPVTFINTSPAAREIDTLKARISKLQSDLVEQRTLNETLLHKSELSRDSVIEVRGLKEHENLEQQMLLKENSELRAELVDVSSRLVNMEAENDSMRFVAENQDDLLGRCLNLEEELQASRIINKDLEENLSRKKKRMEKLQSKKALQKMEDIDSRGFWTRRLPLDNVSNQVDALVQADIRYEYLEEVLGSLRLERDALLQDKVSLNKTMHSLIKENKDLSKNLRRYKDSLANTEVDLERANIKIKKQQAEVQVYSLAHRHTKERGSYGADINEEIVHKLISSQISLAEMDEKMIKLRRELHKAVAKSMFLMTRVNDLQKQRQQT